MIQYWTRFASAGDPNSPFLRLFVAVFVLTRADLSTARIDDA
jgi:hypothetical protein